MLLSKASRTVLIATLFALICGEANSTSYQYQTVNLLTGQVLPGAMVTVYDFGTTTRSTIRKLDGTSQSNPFVSDSNGIAAFAGDNAAYQTIWSQGNYVAPLWSLTTGGAIPVVDIGSVATTACNTAPTVVRVGSATNPILNFTFPACTYNTGNINPGIPLLLQGNAGGGTFATRAIPLTVNRSNADFDTAMEIFVPQAGSGVSSQEYSGLDFHMQDTSGKGTAFRIFDDRPGNGAVSSWWDTGGLWTSTNMNLCTIRLGSPAPGLNQSLVCQASSPGSTGAALNVIDDTVGPAASFAIIGQDATPGVFNTDWRDGSGAFVAGLAADGTLGFGAYRGAVAWSNLDTWIGRGNGAARLQIGGPDAPSVPDQTFAAPSAPQSVTLLGLPSAAGQNVLQYNYNLSGQVPRTIFVGMLVQDTSVSGVIPPGTTVTAINNGSATFTLSNNITGVGVTYPDNLVFSSPDTAGANLMISGGRGTGSGRGGTVEIMIAPPGSSGVAQNISYPAVVFGDTTAPTDFQYLVNAPSYKSGGVATSYILPATGPSSNNSPMLCNIPVANVSTCHF